MTIDMPGRMLRLLSLLQSRREWSGGELAGRLGVTGRTVRRDIDRLRELGYPVEGTTGTAGGYRLASGRNLPPLLLDDDEAVAVAAGLLTAAGGSVTGIEESSVRALAKLEQVLPTRLRHQVAAVGGAIVPMLHRGGPQVDPGTLAVLATACRDHELLAFDYRSRQDETTARRVEPHSLVTTYGRWYLLAYDPERAGWRTFRVDRLRDPTPTRRRFTPRELPDADAAAYVARTISTAPYRYTAQVTVNASAQAVEESLQVPMLRRIEPLDDHTCTVHLGADSLDIIARHLVAVVSLGADFTVSGSSEVLERLHALGRRLVDATQKDPTRQDPIQKDPTRKDPTQQAPGSR